VNNGALRDLLKSIREACGPVFWPTRSYAQEGEDLVLRRLFDGRQGGFYVDVGCHHPFRFSNTYLFYRRGWHGICIDPLPGTVRRFRRWRPRDIAVELGVSLKSSALTYYMFNEPALNTFDEAIAQNIAALGTYRVIEKRVVRTEPLTRIIAESIPSSTSRIDLLTVDVEGLDLEVLQSNDWQRFSPEVVIVECSVSDLSVMGEDPIVKFMGRMGYKPYAKTGRSVVFVQTRCSQEIE